MSVRVRLETPGLEAAKRALVDLEEELRRSDGLPGWGRVASLKGTLLPTIRGPERSSTHRQPYLL